MLSLDPPPVDPRAHAGASPLERSRDHAGAFADAGEAAELGEQLGYATDAAVAVETLAPSAWLVGAGRVVVEPQSPIMGFSDSPPMRSSPENVQVIR